MLTVMSGRAAQEAEREKGHARQWKEGPPGVEVKQAAQWKKPVERKRRPEMEGSEKSCKEIMKWRWRVSTEFMKARGWF